MTNCARAPVYNTGMEVIYLDSLFALNLLADYLLLLCAGRLCSLVLRRRRYLLAALLGAVYAAALYLPGLGFLRLPGWKLLVGGGMGWIAYGRERTPLRCIAVFFAVSAAYGGALWALGGRFSLPGLLGCFLGFFLLFSLLFSRRRRKEEKRWSGCACASGPTGGLHRPAGQRQQPRDPVSGDAGAGGLSPRPAPGLRGVGQLLDPAGPGGPAGAPPGRTLLEGRLRLIPYSALGGEGCPPSARSRLALDGAAGSPHADVAGTPGPAVRRVSRGCKPALTPPKGEVTSCSANRRSFFSAVSCSTFWGSARPRSSTSAAATPCPLPAGPAEEEAPWPPWPRDEPARKLLIEHNLRLVVYIAKRFENTGINIEDLISIGTIGLIKAVNTFQADKKIKLATYASRCIENEILMHLRKIGAQRTELSFDEPLNTDWDGNELLLSDILGTDEDEVSRPLEDDAERRMLLEAIQTLERAGEADHPAALRPARRAGVHPEGGGGSAGHLPELHQPPGEADHPAPAPGNSEKNERLRDKPSESLAPPAILCYTLPGNCTA